ncbi:hypothetical protein FB45DRAFT_894661 [Roridomyces roridus]|uniref:F-box domain-containing protein n=1 Tax=Roridomyces roridus TaxID=1738132 RepID=A0AAD7CGC4_9AGAR|nr:hypothetical protein FB45DRAFT_894661 [Roridomyces roridus]
MHRCFEIPELVDEIVSHIPLRKEYKPSLAVLARTARLFHDSALNRLWRYQRSLRTLLLCMPPDLVQEEIVNEERILKFLRPIQSSDWERPHHYARRVRNFCSMLDDFPYSAICPWLALGTADDCIFPNLTHLLWNQSDQNFPYIGLFLGPKVTSIIARCDTSSPLAILSQLPKKCPSLTHLDFTHPRDDSVTEATRNLISALLRELRCIQTLAIHIYDTTVLQHVARLPCLRSLCVQSLPTTIPPAQGPLFTSLRRLRCEKSIPSSMSRVLELCPDNTLDAFDMGIQGSEGPGGMRQLLATVQNSQRSSLRELRIRSLHSDEGIGDHNTIECMRPALGFAKLTHLHISSRPRFDFDDLAISEMARAWPQLECLEIMEVADTDHIRTTLRSLHHLALHCPNLQTVSMAFTTDIVPSVGDASNQSMSFLNVQLSHVSPSQVPPVAQFLGGIFPNLQEVSSYGIGEHLDDDRWEQVEALLPSHVGESTREKDAEP